MFQSIQRLHSLKSTDFDNHQLDIELIYGHKFNLHKKYCTYSVPYNNYTRGLDDITVYVPEATKPVFISQRHVSILIMTRLLMTSTIKN